MAEYVFNSDFLSHNLLPNKPYLLMDLDSDKWQQYCQRATFPMSLIYKREATLIARYEKGSLSTLMIVFLLQKQKRLYFVRTGPTPLVYMRLKMVYVPTPSNLPLCELFRPIFFLLG